MLRWYMTIGAIWGFNCASNFAFLGPFLFWKGICKVPRCNKLKILVPKQLWKSKIGPLQLILATKHYVTFFLGHPLSICNVILTCNIVKRITEWKKDNQNQNHQKGPTNYKESKKKKKSNREKQNQLKQQKKEPKGTKKDKEE